MPDTVKPSRIVLRHAFDVGVPVSGFLIGSAFSGTTAGAIAAVLCAVLMAVYRLFLGHRVALVALALAVVLVHAGLAQLTGQGRDFFLSDLIINGALATVFVISLLMNRPISGVFASWWHLEEQAWREDPGRMRLHLHLTSWGLALWCLHLLVWVPLYASNSVAGLAFTQVVGIPITVLLLILAWRKVRDRGTHFPASPGPRHASAKESRS